MNWVLLNLKFCLCTPLHRALELPPLDVGLFDFDLADSLSLPFHWENLSQLELELQSPPEFFSPDKHMTADEKPPARMIKLEYEEGQHEQQQQREQIERGFNSNSSWRSDVDEKKRRNNMRLRRSKSSVLGLEEIQNHFHIPISEAAKQMNVGLTVLKKRCRELNIMRWPHRKLKSLNSLIKNVKVYILRSNS